MSPLKTHDKQLLALVKSFKYVVDIDSKIGGLYPSD